MKLIKRTLEAEVIRLMRLFPVVTVTGPRQSGKTTLAQTVAKNFRYVSFENPDIRENARKDPRGFLRQYSDKTIFDEIQQVPELASYLQEVIDQENRPGMFLLTGSQNLTLHAQVSQSLAGRTAMLSLLPFEYSEVHSQTARKDWDFDQWIINGFYPRVFSQGIPPSDFYQSYFETYIQRDVRQIQNIQNLSGFINFIRLCAGRTGQLLDLSSLANDTGISVNTAKGWLSVLEASYIIFLLQPYYKNLNQRVIKSPKLYFYDTGLSSWLLKITDRDQLQSHYLRGGLFENLIIADLLKQSAHRVQQDDLYFLRNSNGVEIDCLRESSVGLELIEIKSGQTFNQSFLSDLMKWGKTIQEPTLRKSLVYAGEQETEQSGIRVSNWKKYLLNSANY